MNQRSVQSASGLLEEWPSQYKVKSQVVFSEYSTCYRYKCDSTYRSSMSYSTAKIKKFHAQALSEALCVNCLIACFPSKNAGDAINLLVTNQILKEDELLGIEHLIGEETGDRLKLKRREHVNLVLSIQMRMREKNEEDVDKLARIASSSSKRSVQKSRLRAFLAM